MTMTNISWIDKATIKRQITVNNGHFDKNSTIIVYENIPCHLSEKTLTNAYQKQQVDTVNYDFKLFCARDIDIRLNDIIEVVTASGQNYTVYAGRSRRYAKTCQTSCYFTPVAVGER